MLLLLLQLLLLLLLPGLTVPPPPHAPTQPNTGTRIFLNQYSLHRHPAYWPRPLEWLPERWLEGGEALAARHPGAYIPFGAGPLSCIGRQYAQVGVGMRAGGCRSAAALAATACAPLPAPQLSMTLAAAEVLRRVALGLPEGGPSGAPPLKQEMSMKAEGGLRLAVWPAGGPH